MLLTLTTTHHPAPDLGYLLGKHPARAQSFELAHGAAHVFYPEVTLSRTTAALLLEIDPIGLVRGTPDREAWVEHYVNDRPYAASSLLSVALAQVFRQAMAGVSRDRAELAAQKIPLEARVYALPARGGETFVRKLFEPLGYAVTVGEHPLDPHFPAWGPSPYLDLTLSAETRLSDLLTHLYVLIPVLDNEKHYWVGDEEVEKLLVRGEGWLERHPQKAVIASRYLKGRHNLARAALDRLNDAPEDAPLEVQESEEAQLEQVLIPENSVEISLEYRDIPVLETAERALGLHEQRLETVTRKLLESGAARVLDLGCGEGKLISHLLREAQFNQILGLDVSVRTLERAARRLKLDRMPEKQRARVTLLQGSLTYRDARISGFDGAALVEVIEHLDLPRLSALERSVFEFARPGVVVITTPNVEYNVLFPTLEAGKFRHRDHRFEWTRAEFAAWAQAVGSRFGYALEFFGVGPEDLELGPPSQGVVFQRSSVHFVEAEEPVARERGE